MKIVKIQQQNNKEQKPVFKGIADTSLRFLAENQAVGANAVDVCFMVTPRTASDLIGRGPAAGAETFRRESMGTFNDSAMGLYGMAAGGLLAYGVNKQFNIDANSILAAPETLNILAQNKANQFKDNKSQVEYLKEILSQVKAYNPISEKADKEGYVKLSDKTINKVAEILDTVINDKDLQYSKSLTQQIKEIGKDKSTIKHAWINDEAENSRKVVMNLLTEETGAQAKYVLKSSDGKIVSNTNLETLVSDIFKVSRAFNSEKVQEKFKEQVKENKSINENGFVKEINNFLKKKSYAGFVIATAVGLSVQPINMYLTKLKTGSDGFVGVEGRTKDDSAGFWALKAASGVGFFAMILKTLGCKLSDLKNLPKEFMAKMAFKGAMPTIEQLKGVYGLTIISRFLSARDKDELRESATKDILGYFSWLVLGNIVNRLVASSLEKPDTIVLDSKEGAVKGFWNNCKHAYKSSLKSRDEILIETLQKNGISTIKQENGKNIAKSFKELVKDLDKLPKEIAKSTKKRMSILNKAQLAGYAFSGLVLGLGIPNLNIYVTNKLDQMRKAKKAQQEEQVA